MNGEGFLRDKARELIAAGRVPRRLPDRVWGGSAFGGRCCMLCAIPVAPNEIALEVELPSNTEMVHAHFHSPCFLALELEILSMKADAPGSTHSDPATPAAMINRGDPTGALEASQP